MVINGFDHTPFWLWSLKKESHDDSINTPSWQIVTVLLYRTENFEYFISFFSAFPSCANSELQKLVEVDQHESVQLKCQYHSSSASGPLSFGWSMNSTKDSVDFPKSDFSVDGEKSILTFSAKTDMDFGTVTCNAADQVGPTNNPCTFQIVPKGNIDTSLLHLSIYQSILTYFLKELMLFYFSKPVVMAFPFFSMSGEEPFAFYCKTFATSYL